MAQTDKPKRTFRRNVPIAVRLAGFIAAFMVLVLAIVISSRRASSDYECLRLDAASGVYGDTTPYASLMFDLTNEQWLPRSSLEQAAMGYPANYIPEKPLLSPDGDYVAYVLVDSSYRLIVRTTDVTRRVVLYQALDAIDDQSHLWWSPDSHWVAYLARQTNGDQTAVLTEIKSPHRTRIVPIALGPDGRFIGWSADSQFLTVGDWDGARQTFYVLRMDDFQVVMTSQHPQLDPRGDSWTYNNGRDAKWSPRGDWFAYEMQQPDKSQLVLLSPEQKSETTFDLSGNTPDRWTFSWSPQGSYVATLSYAEESYTNEHLDIFGIDGSALTNVAHGVKNANCWDSCQPRPLYWASDEASITYIDAQPAPSYGTDLITFWLKTHRYETVGVDLYADPELVGDGQWLSMYTLIAPDMEPISNTILFSLTERRKITLTTSNDIDNVSFSPDGTMVVAWYNPSRASTPATNQWQPGGNGLIWTHLSDGLTHAVEPTAKEVAFLNWSANGQWFVYLVAPEGKRGETYLAIANTITGETRHLSNIGTPLSMENPYTYWALPAPNGRYIAIYDAIYDSNANALNHNIHLIALDGSTTQDVMMLPGDMADFIWSPDSTRFAFVSEDPNGISLVNVFAADGHLIKQIAFGKQYYFYKVTAFTRCNP